MSIVNGRAKRGRFQILSLSGGGYLGLYTAAFLEKLEEAAGGPLADRFDLIAGTSIGGILALGLADGKRAKNLRIAFEKHGEAIFSSKAKPRHTLGRFREFSRSVLRARYRADAFASAIDAMIPPHTLIGDLTTRIMIPAVNLTKGSPQVFKTPHHPDFVRDHKLCVRDVALATSAAPTYFPIHAIKGELFADGGLYANAPDALALHETEHFLRRHVDDVHVLSVGTTSTSFSMSRNAGLNLGSWGWLNGQRLSSVMIASQQKIVESMLQHRLGDRYIWIDHEQSAEQQAVLGLDVATSHAAGDLKGLAEGSARQMLNDSRLLEMLSHRAPSFRAMEV